MGVEQIVQVVLVLGLTLVALIVVILGKRDADAERRSAEREATSIREETRNLMAETQRREERIALREREIAEDQRSLGAYQRQLDERAAGIAKGESKARAQLDAALAKAEEALAAAAGMKAKEAKEELLRRLEAAAEAEAAGTLRKIEKRLAAEAQERAREILIGAMQRQVHSSSTQQTVSWVSLPSEEMKGRVIGREGRNIRTFEALTGVNVILEDGVNAVMLSSFDPERREIAEATLASLVADGRIQPQRVEAAYAAAVAAAPARARAAALDAAEEAGVVGLGEPLIEILGRLRLRTSYGQNVLAHSVESASLAADLAREVGADIEATRRAAFLHDLGKAFGADRAGTHAAIGAEEASASGEDAIVVNAIAAHHDEVPMESLEAVLVQIADTISASRPGARREDLDDYVERLGALEALVRSIEGVADVVAMQAGREVRVVVAPDIVGDDDLADLARTIAKRIDETPKYPGEVKVTVIRELRAEAVAGEA